MIRVGIVGTRYIPSWYDGEIEDWDIKTVLDRYIRFEHVQDFLNFLRKYKKRKKWTFSRVYPYVDLVDTIRKDQSRTNVMLWLAECPAADLAIIKEHETGGREQGSKKNDQQSSN